MSEARDQARVRTNGTDPKTVARTAELSNAWPKSSRSDWNPRAIQAESRSRVETTRPAVAETEVSQSSGALYRRVTVDGIKKVLNHARKKIAQVKKNFRRSFRSHKPTEDDSIECSEKEFRESMQALNDKKLWMDCLRKKHLAGNPQARAAVNSLIRSIETITTEQITKDSLTLLDSAVAVLLAEINAIDIKSVSNQRVTRLKDTADSIGWQIVAAGAAISATSAASGSELAAKAILAGLSGSVASLAVAAVHDWRGQEKSRNSISDNKLLKQAHQDLILEIAEIALYISRRKDGESQTREETMRLRHTLLQARFASMFARQLAAGRESSMQGTGYAAELTDASDFLAYLQRDIRRIKRRDLSEVILQVTKLQGQLERYGELLARPLT
jgi:hypothetical protein